MEMNNDIFTPDPHIPEPVDSEDIPISAPAKDETPAETPPPRRRTPGSTTSHTQTAATACIRKRNSGNR